MELTTRCPQCETAFPVSLEQLQLRKGYIRCIQCANIFDGFDAVVPAAEASAGKRQEPAVGSRPDPVASVPRAEPVIPKPVPVPPAPVAPTLAGAETKAPAPAPVSSDPVPRPSAPLSSGPRPTPVAPVPGEPKLPAAGPVITEPRLPRAVPVVNEPTLPPLPTEGNNDIVAPSWTAGASSRSRAEPVIGAGALAKHPASSREPSLPSVVRQRGDAGGPGYAPKFTISEPTSGSVSGRRPMPVFTASDPEPTEPADEEDRAPDYLYVDPSPGRRSERHQAKPFDGTLHRPAWLTPVWLVLIICGLVLLLAQAIYVYRGQLANNFPNLRPVLEAACERLSCAVPYERQIGLIAITGSALRSSGAPKDDVSSLTLEVTLRNTHERPQEWPTLVLDLKDASGAVVVRRNLAPSVWVPASLRSGPFAAGSELTVQVPLSVRSVQANGYQLDKFFP